MNKLKKNPDDEYILSYLPKNLLELIGNRKKIQYNGKNLKVAYLIDIVHVLIHKSYLVDRSVFNLYSMILREKYGTFYNFYIDYLVENNIIWMTSNYCVGKKSKTYLIPPSTLSDVINFENKDNILFNKYKNYHTINYLKRLNYKFIPLDTMVRLVQNLRLISIDIKSTHDYIKNLGLDDNKMIRNMHNAQCIENKNIWFKFDKYGRFHSNMTTLKSEIRQQFLYIDGEATREIDIANSQPVFLTQLMSKHLHLIDIDEYETFKNLVINGRLYEYVSNHTSVTSRKDIKKLIYTVLFGTNHLNKKENRYFSELFPSIFRFICTYKNEKNSYKALSYELQQSESNLLFNFIIRDLMMGYPDVPFFTVHDSIVVKDSNYEVVKRIFDANIRKVHLSL